MQGLQRQRSEDYKVLCGTCPDEECQAKLFFPAYDKSVECAGCGQRHEQSALQNIAEVTNPSVALHNILKNILLGNVKPKKGPDNVKVLGLSNYVCKSISPILTRYGMDKKTGKAKLLTELSQPEIFDCGRILGDRAFLIEDENLDIVGYGRDKTGSVRYLKDILKEIKIINDNEERLVPIHADGDGHCLVHAVSRALVGRELFWHALRLNLLEHFKSYLPRYKEHFKDFIDIEEWSIIIEECNPDFIPTDGEPLGLRNIHVFGLANVLHRPVILLDSFSGMQSCGDYSGVFLPALFEPDQCRGKDKSLNKPLCIAWSSMGRNHYIPLVGVKGRPQPVLPRSMIQRAWGVPAALIDKYMDFNEKGNCVIGGDKCLSDKYIRTLVTAMEEVFIEKNRVPPQLVADVHQFLYKSSGIVGVKLDEVVATTQTAVQEKELFKCLTCEALIRYTLPPEWFRKGGSLYSLAVKTHNALRTDKKYAFPFQGVTCTYDKDQDCLVPDMAKCKLSKCSFCQGDNVRLVNIDGSVQYINGDRTAARSTSGRCACGFKHFWDNKEYDNLPEIFPISLEWNGKVVAEKVVWFQYEDDPSMNSNVFEVAQKLVQKHFPGEFGSERLVQRVVDTILRQTASRISEENKEGTAGSKDVAMAEDNSWTPDSPSKIILTSFKHKTMHKEELTMSGKEKQIKKQVEVNAPKNQQKKTKELSALPKSTPKKSKPDIPATKTTPETSASSSVAMETASATLPVQKKVRIATSDGRQVMLSLPEEVTFSDLQSMIEKSVAVPPERQKIRTGFPPKELKPPVESDKYIPLQHGEKIAVEILPDPSAPHPSHFRSYGGISQSPSRRSPRHSWGSFGEDTNTSTAESLLQSLKEASEATDSLDATIASLTIMASIAGKDLWTQVQGMPHLFSTGGLFYKQMERDLGLVDGKHCQLPSLPGKVFRFNANEDRLELCLEPYGHFPVAPNIERTAIEDSQREDVHFGSSGAIKHDTKHVAFSGQGHSMRNMSERMPQDISESFHHHTARNIASLCDPSHHGKPILEESESDLIDSDTKTSEKGEVTGSEGHYQRLGPGYSVLDPSNVNATNQSVAMFKELAENIQRTMQDIDEEMERIDAEEDKKQSSASVSSSDANRIDSVSEGKSSSDQSKLDDNQDTMNSLLESEKSFFGTSSNEPCQEGEGQGNFQQQRDNEVVLKDSVMQSDKTVEDKMQESSEKAMDICTGTNEKSVLDNQKEEENMETSLEMDSRNLESSNINVEMKSTVTDGVEECGKSSELLTSAVESVEIAKHESDQDVKCDKEKDQVDPDKKQESMES